RMMGSHPFRWLALSGLSLLALGMGAWLQANPTAPAEPPAFQFVAEVPAAADPGVRLAKGPVPAPDVKAVVEGNAAFAADLYQRIRGSEAHLIFSPYSIPTGLGMVQLGARNDTADEIAKAMHFRLPGERLHPALGELMRDLNAKKVAQPYQLNVVNSL